MQLESRKFKKVYLICGETTAGKSVAAGFVDRLSAAITDFKQTYPRFRGKAEIQIQMAEDFGNGLLSIKFGEWKSIASFQTIKELEHYNRPLPL